MSMEWEWVDGYDNTTYTDDLTFEVDKGTKLLQQIDEQIMVSGENRSQFIRFAMDRYYDGVDLSEKTLQIIYITEGEYSDINLACCVEKNDEQIRFGWVVPAAACYEPGTLSFSIEAVGDDYVWKTRVYDIEVYDGLNGGEIIPEPEEKAWYIELQERCDYVLNQATAAKDAAAGSASDAAESEANALSYKTDAQLSKEAAASSETNAAASEANAKLYSEQAGAVFALAGDVSFTIGDDKGVTMIFTTN
jgi:hypothetical protein